MVFHRSIKSIEDEIIHQILFAELAFSVCSIIPSATVRGADILPYFYNLNFSKGLIALHSLLLSNESEEISLKNYITQHNWEYKKPIDKVFQKSIADISKEFKAIYPQPLRNKIAAHTSKQFTHTYFVSAYILPHTLPQMVSVTQKLKEDFSNFCNYSPQQLPFINITEQTKKIVEIFLDRSYPL